MLLLGHARIEDLARTYEVDLKKKHKASAAPINGHSSKALSDSPDGKAHVDRGEKVSIELTYQTVLELLQAGLVHYVHESHFRSDADNRIEAEKQTKSVGEYKARNRSDREAMWNAEVKLKLEGWKYGTKIVTDGSESHKGRKRRSEHVESSFRSKRRRLSIDGSRDDSETMGEFDEPVSGDSGPLKVWIGTAVLGTAY